MGERVRTIRARLDGYEEDRRRIQRRQRRLALPAPAPIAVATAIAIIEVRAGVRPPHQLERLSHYTLWRFWPCLADRRDNSATPIVPRPLAVTIRELTPGLADATVVVGFGGRTHALALRLDGAPGFWQLIELDYPAEWRPQEPPVPNDRAPTFPGPTSDPPSESGHARPWPIFPDPTEASPPALRPERDPHEDLGIELE